jgi:hypothetical protein
MKPEQLSIHVVCTFLAIERNAGSERGVGWNWLKQISSRVKHVTAVVPSPVHARMKRLGGIPQNVEVLSPVVDLRMGAGWPIPAYYLDYIRFNQAAKRLTSDIPADLSHQVTLGTPYWGSSLGNSGRPRVLGPVGVSATPPLWAGRELGMRASAEVVARTLIRRWDGPPAFANAAIESADHVFVADPRAMSMAVRRGRQFTPMPPDGANPVPITDLTGFRDREHLVWAGSLMSRKGAALAVKAFAEAVPSVPRSAHLVICGDGREALAVASLVSELNLANRVDLMGQVSRSTLLGLLGDAKALVFSSLRDTFGGVVLEAAERATPSIVAQHSGVDGLFSWLDPRAAWTAPVGSRREMTAFLGKSMVAALGAEQEEWAARSTAAYSFAVANDWRRRAECLTSVYEELCFG